MDCQHPNATGAEIANNIDKALKTPRGVYLDSHYASFRALDEVINSANKNNASCDLTQNKAIASEVMNDLEAKGILPKTALTYVHGYYNFLSEHVAGSNERFITTESLDSVINSPVGGSPPPPVEKDLLRYFGSKIGFEGEGDDEHILKRLDRTDSPANEDEKASDMEFLKRLKEDG